MLRSIYLLSFLLLQSLFAFAGNVKENVPSSFDLYVCIGQSNMAGRATLTPEVMDTLQNVYLLNDKGNFEPAVNPLNRYSTAFFTQDYKLIVFHFVVVNLTASNFDGTGSYVIQESTVMAD